MKHLLSLIISVMGIGTNKLMIVHANFTPLYLAIGYIRSRKMRFYSAQTSCPTPIN